MLEIVEAREHLDPLDLASGGGQEDIPRPLRPVPLREALLERPDVFPHVRVADTYVRLRQIGALRYGQYVQAQGKPYASVVRDRGCLLELMDFASVNLFATDRQGLTAAMRVGALMGTQHPRATHFHTIAKVLCIDPGRTLTCTRLVRAPRHSGRHAVDLIAFNRLQAVRGGWRYCVMQTSEPFVRFFQRQGFVSSGIWIDDECAGRLVTMILDTREEPVLQSSRAAAISAVEPA